MAIALVYVSHPWIETLEQSKNILYKMVEYSEIIDISSVFKREGESRKEFDARLEFCFSLSTTESAESLSEYLKKISTEVTKKREDSEIKICLLFYDNEVNVSPEMTIPNPIIQFDNFALHLANEIWARYEHPVLKKTLQEIAASRPTVDTAEFILQGQVLFG